MTIEEMKSKLKELGIKKAFKTYWEPESETICIKTRKPTIIQDGIMSGSDINIHDDKHFCIWTSKKSKARAYSDRYSINVRLLDGEAELFVPIGLCDEILPKFGAIVKREMSPEAKEAAKIRLQQARNKRLA